jgi:hypothetical protein
MGVGVTLALLSSLLVGVLPALAVSQPTVTIAPVPPGQSDISAVNSDYTITFITNRELVAGDVITITFPVDTVVAAALVAPSISASPGWITNPAPPPPTIWGGPTWGVAGAWATNPAARQITYTLGAGDNVGSGATMNITLPDGLTNPSSPGDYTLTVFTNKEPTPVTSTPYTITTPSLFLPGTVSVYNGAGILMNVFSGARPISDAIAWGSTLNGFSLEAGPGYYDETIVINKGITLKSTGGAAVTFIKDVDYNLGAGWTIPPAAYGASGNGTVTITSNQTAPPPPAGSPPVVLDGFTIEGDIAGAVPVTITGEGVTVQNCVFTKANHPALGTAGQAMVVYDPGVWGVPMDGVTVFGSTITNCSFDTTARDVVDWGIVVFDNAMTISDNTFVIDSNTLIIPTNRGAQDMALQITGGLVLQPTAISGNTITGSSGVGIHMLGGLANSVGDSLSGLFQALDVDAGTLIVDGSTIDACGTVVTTPPPLINAAVDVASPGAGLTTLTMVNSTVSNSPGYAYLVQASATAANAAINVIFNTISGNAMNIDNQAVYAAPGVNFSHNYWGDAAGPAPGSITHATAPPVERVDTSNHLGAPATGSFSAPPGGTSNFNARDQGVTVAIVTTSDFWTPGGLPSNAAIIGVAIYPENPEGPTPQAALPDGFYDVYIGVPGNASDIATITIVNPNVTADTQILVWNDLAGDWWPADDQGTNPSGGSAWFRTGPGIWPTMPDMSGTPVALVTAPMSAPAQATMLPANGTDGTKIKPSFAWGEVAGADSYEFQIAEDVEIGSPFDILEDSASTTTNGHVSRDNLKYETTYWWRVRAVRGAEYSNWVTAFFTTMAEPEEEPEPAPPVIVEENPPAQITVEIPPAQEVQVIPDYLLWVVVGVGAVLVIAVIVLIVRTRRVA